MPDEDNRSHILISDTSRIELYTSPVAGGGHGQIRPRNRQQHGERLLAQLNTVRAQSEVISQEARELGIDEGLGIRVSFESEENDELAIESLARDRQGIELLNVRKSDDVISATVYVPPGKLEHYEKQLRKYLEEETQSGKPKNQNLITSIEQIKMAAFNELWTDDDSVIPEDENEEIVWEIWLPTLNDRNIVLEQFRNRTQLLGLDISDNHIEFPERTVVTLRGSKQQITSSTKMLDSIAEIRRLKETAEFFAGMPIAEQQEWTDDLLNRTTFDGESDIYVTILDTGVNQGNPLLTPILGNNDLHTVDPAWGVGDIDGHGTGMAGLATYGDLTEILESEEAIDISHRLESVKLLRQGGNNAERHHGDLTAEAVARVEIHAPDRNRVICMAVTSEDNRDRGRPSAWSAVIDSLASGATDDTKRLIIISNGNVEFGNLPDYPDGNTTDSIHDPGQAWNALTIGAYTEKVDILDDAFGYTPLAPEGGLSPHSTTSAIWNSNWPMKPDVVFEGGNLALNELGPIGMSSLKLLTTHFEPQNILFDYFDATSAATALASKLAAELSKEYPELWPESIRALIVHSARWTDAMIDMYLPENPNTSDYEILVRHCGFGVPNRERAFWSASNALTLIAQDRVQPYWKPPNSSPRSRDMNLHEIPWPRESLLELEDMVVSMRVSLSYFVEPNPSDRGFSGRYRYASHGLRFDVRRADETEDNFRARINRAARDEEAGTAYGGDGGGWLIGKQRRNRGSIHTDIWKGTAADLSNRYHIAVYPAIGWWRERQHLERYSSIARYALIISIETPETGIDIYNEVSAQIPIPVEIET